VCATSPFGLDNLDVWANEFPYARVERLRQVGHFPALEATDRLVEAALTTGTNPS
jgi:hypothetical protein